MGPSLFSFIILIFFFRRLIITCRLWAIYVREDNYSNVYVMIKRIIWTIWSPMSSVLKKADKLNLSLSLSSLNSSLGFAGGKHYQKFAIPIFRFVIQNFAIPCRFRYILLCCYPFSLLPSGWFVIAVCGSISVQGTSQAFRIIVNWCRVAISNDKST